MNTDIEYLRQLETDLEDAAGRERTRIERAAAPARRGRGRTWVKVAGVAAAFLVVAGAIGYVAGGGANEAALQGSADPTGVSDERDAFGGQEPAASPPPGDMADRPAFIENEGGAEERGRDDLAGSPEAADGRQRDLSKIIRDGRIGVVVGDGRFGDAVGDLTFIAEQHGGFILSSSTQRERSGTFVLRIPAHRFDRALAQIRDLGEVRFQRIEGDDVTAEFIDNQARLRILLARKALLFDLFQQAGTTEEILRLAGQLDEVQLRIEQIQGQLRFLKDQVAESTLRVSIQERNAPMTRSASEVENPDLGSSVDLAVQGFLRIVGAVVVGLGYLIPLTLIGALLWMAAWFARRRREAA